MPLGAKGLQKKGDVKANEAGHAGEDAAAIEAAHLFLALASPSDAAFSTPSPRQTAAKRRRSEVDSLSEKSWQSEWYREETHTKFLLESRNVELTSAKITLRSKKARAAAAVRWSGYVEDEEGAVFEKDAKTGALGPGMAAARRITIGFFFVHHHGSPPVSEWGGRGGIISLIMRRVSVPEGFKDLERKVLEDVTDA
jgi:hypothetical protein